MKICATNIDPPSFMNTFQKWLVYPMLDKFYFVRLAILVFLHKFVYALSLETDHSR